MAEKNEAGVRDMKSVGRHRVFDRVSERALTLRAESINKRRSHSNPYLELDVLKALANALMSMT